MSKEIYEIPSSIKELFINGERAYRIIDYSREMDNNQSMQHFIECVDISSDNIDLDDGTQLYLKHPDYEYLAVVNASGLGDFFSHSFEVSFVKPETYEAFSPK